MATNTPKKASRKDWHPADIKAALDKAGWTLRALAAHHGIRGSSTLSHTLAERSYPANEKRIADGTKKPRGLRAIRLQSTLSRCQRNGNELQAA